MIWNENLTKLKKNIEKDIAKNIIKNGLKKTESNITPSKKDIIEGVWKTLNTKREEMPIIENITRNIDENLRQNLLSLKVENVSDVEKLMNELLRYTTLMEEKNGRLIFVKLLHEWIGKNWNSFVPIATELSIASDCGSSIIGELPHWICKKNRALESLLIGSLRDLRVFWYKKKARDKSLDEKLKTWYSVAEQSIKVIMNASYGVFGAESFLFYCPPLAEEVTAIARHIIGKTIGNAQDMGMDVLYGDTDSIFVKNPPKEKLEELIKWTQDKFGIEFEVDKIYRYVCLSGRKKNYLGVTTDGDVDVKGLTGKKKHTPFIIKNTFNETKEILKEVKTPEQMEVSKKKIIGLIKRVYKTFKNREWENMKDLSFNVTVTRELDEYKKTTPQHVKAARMLKAQGHDIEAGTNISFVKTNKKVSGGVTVKPVELAKREEVDVSKYIEFLKSTFEQILDPLGISFNEDILGIKPLDSWLSKST